LTAITKVNTAFVGTGTATATNFQDGDNRLTGSQIASSATGDGAAGQVVGAVSGGATSIDATNRSIDSSVESGDADTSNSSAASVGLEASQATFSFASPKIGDVSGVSANNVQDGDNAKHFAQSASAVTGDGVAGQVTGVVTSAGGSASVVLDNTSNGIDTQSGDGRFDNAQKVFVGLRFSSSTAAPI
jgi:hypothetical protein